MRYLIDGNNLMGHRSIRFPTLARHELLKELLLFGGNVTVVFDGAPEPNFPDGSSYSSIQLFYSRRGSNADNRILEIIQDKQYKNSIVITSDGELKRKVRAHGIKVMRSDQFREKLQSSVTTAKTKPTVELNEMELASWMRYFGVDETDDLVS